MIMGVRDRGRKYSIVEVEWHRKWLAVKLIKTTGDGWLCGTGPYLPPGKLITVMINNIQANENCDSLSTWDETRILTEDRLKAILVRWWFSIRSIK